MKSFSDVISIHTSAREVTGDARWRMQRHGYFNPHFRKGSDYTGQRRRAGHRISIHTSAREVTGETYCCRRLFYISIHTSAREVTTHCTKWRRSLSISIHTSAREVTAISCRTGGEHGNFNPHFRKGSDGGNRIANGYKNFNPHFRKGSDELFADAADKIAISIHTSAREVTGG